MQTAVDDVQPLARALATAVATTLEHGADHHSARREARRARSLARRRISSAQPWRLDVGALKGVEDVSSLLSAMKRHRLEGLVLMPGASTYEIHTLVGKLASAPESDGLGPALKRHGVLRLWPMEKTAATLSRVDLLATVCAALEAVGASKRLEAELVSVAEAGLRAAEALKETLES